MIKRKFLACIGLVRPELSLSAAICVVAGQIIAAGALPDLKTGLLGFVCGFALSASALVFNDYFDLEVDRINAPQRPLPSGAVSIPELMILASTITLAGLLSAFALGMAALLVSIIFWCIGFLYNWRFKQSGLPGNLMVSASVAVTFILGAMTVRMPWSGTAWAFSIMAFFIDLGEEIAGDAMDMEGDKKRGSRSIALLYGRQFALRLSAILWSLVILTSFVPLLAGWLGMVYLVFILCTDFVIIFFTMRLLKSQDSDSGHKAMRGIYLGATIGLVAFLAGLFI